MKLSNSLLKDFAASVNAGKNTSTYQTVFGTAVVQNGKKYVKIDGSNQATPVSLATDIENGDRVLVNISNHTAIVLGNATSPASGRHATETDAALAATKLQVELLTANSVTTDYLKANYATIENLTAATASIENLVATKADIATLEANYATIKTLESDYATIKALNATTADINSLIATKASIDDLSATNAAVERLTAATADIETLVAKKADIETLDAVTANIEALVAKKADIDLANVNNAWIENGVIKDAAISDAQIIGVSANKLTAGTIDAAKITVKNLNADNITVGTINGKLIGSGSVDLDKLSEEVPTKEYLDGVEADLQKQIDASIETFSVTEIPTLNNSPAVDWTDSATRLTHVGDVCYVVNAASSADGYCYRFTNTGTTASPSFEWTLIKDRDVTKALQELVDAQGDISGLKSFETSTSKWITDTDEEMSSLKTRISSAETNLGKKVDSTTFNEVKQTVDENSSSITTLTKTVNTKADNSTVEAIAASATEYMEQTDAALTALKTADNQLNTAIKGKADSATVTTLTNTVNTVKQTADTNRSDISALTKTVSEKADSSTVTELSNTVNTIKQTSDTNTASISSLTKTVDTKADASTVDALADSANQYMTWSAYKFDDLELADRNLQNNIDNKADSSTVTTLTSTVNTVKQTADSNTASIKTLTTTTDDLGTRMSAAESSITQNADNIELKVSKDGVISSINQSSESVTISADKVTLAGGVTITNAINSANSTAETASADASTALSNSKASIASVEVQYYKSTSASSLSGGSWSESQPTWEEGTYIWSRTKTTTKSGTVSYSNAACITGNTGAQGAKGSTGATGAAGTGISSIEEHYAISSSNTEAPVDASATNYIPSSTGDDGSVFGIKSGYALTVKGGVESSSSTYVTGYIPVSKGDVIKVYDGSGSIDTTVVVALYSTKGTSSSNIGKYIKDMVASTLYGAVSISGNCMTWDTSSISYYFWSSISYARFTLRSADSVVTINEDAVSSWTTTVPTMTETNRYLWNYETINYTNGVVKDTEKRVIGVYGDTGVGISSVVPQYYLSSSNSAQAGGSWSTTEPTWKSGYYIWTRSYITYDDGNFTTTTPVLASALNSANSTAYQANTLATSAKARAESTAETIAAWCYGSDTTYIDGGKIYTGSITAKQIDVNDLFAQSITATGSISGLTGDFTGKITASSGTIGGWSIGEKRISSSSSIYIGKKEAGMMLTNDAANEKPYICVQDASSNKIFAVEYDGALTSTNATIKGAIQATSMTVNDALYLYNSSYGTSYSVIASTSTSADALAVRIGINNSATTNITLWKEVINSMGQWWHSGRFTVEGSLYIGSDALYYVSATGSAAFSSLRVSGNIVLDNGKYIRMLNAAGTERTIVNINSSADEVHFGNGDIPTVIYGTEVRIGPDVTCQSGLTVGGTATLKGATSISGTLTASGTTNITGALTASGTTKITGDVTASGAFTAANSPTLVWAIGNDSTSVALRRSGNTGSYELSLVYTNSSGSNTFHTLVDNYGARKWYASGDNISVGTITYKVLSGGTGYYPIGSQNSTGSIAYMNSHLNSSSTAYLGVYGKWDGSSWTNKNIISASSDIRLKTNIQDSVIDALSVIEKIQVRQFDWIENGYHQNIGFVADELETLDSKLAFGGGYTDDGAMDIKSVDTFYLLGYVVKGMQELHATSRKQSEIQNGIESQIQALQMQLNQLMTQLHELQAQANPGIS